jgi:dipeptidyl aminopeptidase/acylaminoacyl peptidase
VVLALCALGCGGNTKRDLKAAKQSVYDTDFAVVFSAALEATRQLYPQVEDSPGAGAIKTAWHQVQYANSQDDLANQRTIAQGQGIGVSPALQGTSMPTRLAYKRYFIRFDVAVVGGRPWRIKVVGHAAEWEPGNAMPTELHGPARPHWLEGRTDALTVAIYRHLKDHAVEMREPNPDEKPEDALPKTDPKTWKGLPPGAGERLAKLKDAIVLRDYGALRAQLADDVVWSLGGAPGADTAMAMWQADPEALDALVHALESCAPGADGKRVTCPGGPPVAGAWQLVLELRGKDWKVASFVKGE